MNEPLQVDGKFIFVFKKSSETDTESDSARTTSNASKFHFRNKICGLRLLYIQNDGFIVNKPIFHKVLVKQVKVNRKHLKIY